GVVGIAEPVGTLGVGQVGDAEQELADAGLELVSTRVERLLLLTERLALELLRLGLVDVAVATEPADLLRQRVHLRPHLVALGGQLSQLASEVAHLDERRRRHVVVAPSEGRAHLVELGADALEIDHGTTVDAGRRRAGGNRRLRTAAASRRTGRPAPTR